MLVPSRPRPTPRRRPRWLCAAALATALGLLAPAAASALPCDLHADPTQLSDGQGFTWDNDAGGQIVDGTADAFDTADGLFVQVGVNPVVPYAAPDPSACAREDGEREIVFPEQDVNGLKVSRKLYIPATGAGFARWLNIVRNPSPAPITALVRLRLGELGSDDATQVVSSSSGDATMALGDAWAVTDDSLGFPGFAVSRDPGIAHVWQYDGAGAADAVDAIPEAFQTNPAPNEDVASVEHQNVTVDSGATVIYMQLVAQRQTSDQALSAARTLGAGPAAAYAGISDAERAQLRNWPADADGDRDGRLNRQDNCPDAANADQADLDGDGLGDACDPDVDGDGVTNADEAARGTDPRKPDTDGDGKGDRIDACPTTAGLGDTGCPRFDDRTPPLLTISGVRRTLRYTSFLRGVKASATTNEPATLKFELFAAARSGTISKSAFNLRLRRVALRLATGTRSVRLRFARGVLGDARRFVVLLRVTATDASGNRIAASRRIRVR